MLCRSTLILLVVAASVSACGGSSRSQPAEPSTETPAATPRAVCGPGSRPETGIQGRVSREEHDSGRAAEGYSCNTELVGAYTVPNAIGTVGGFK
ncbi:MAG: LVIVD repeat-containing protein, partial [Candidatus Binatia bacterium]